eukprot:3948869-Prymnesium_polylepis.1
MRPLLLSLSCEGSASSSSWPMAYDAPGGGNGRYARPVVPLARSFVVQVELYWPIAYDAPCGGSGRYARPA